MLLGNGLGMLRLNLLLEDHKWIDRAHQVSQTHLLVSPQMSLSLSVCIIRYSTF